MKDAREIDFLIVGQGLAGSAVAMRALAANYRIVVIDNPSANRASVVAPGLFNPITGQRNLKTWMADKVFPALHEFYDDVQRLTGRRFFYPMAMYKPFLSVEEQNDWVARSAEDRFAGYIASVDTSPLFGGKVNEPFGGITLLQAGYLDTRAYLEAVRLHLRARNAYREETFSYELLTAGEDRMRYGDIKARKVVFCQGVDNASNPWFKGVPVKSLKGEFLTVQCDWRNDVILNRGVYVVPGPRPNEWRVGGTYNRNDHRAEVTAWARNEIVSRLDELIRIPYTVTGQHWGVRPVSPDRRPIMGAHPENDSLIIFNGLGAKGVSLAPYFSGVLIRWLERKGTIHKEADVSRFN